MRDDEVCEEVCDCGWLIPSVTLQFKGGTPQPVSIEVKCPKCGEVLSNRGFVVQVGTENEPDVLAKTRTTL